MSFVTEEFGFTPDELRTGRILRKRLRRYGTLGDRVMIEFDVASFLLGYEVARRSGRRIGACVAAALMAAATVHDWLENGVIDGREDLALVVSSGWPDDPGATRDVEAASAAWSARHSPSDDEQEDEETSV